MTQAKSQTFETDLLVFGPHPDDIELFCGGLVALTASQGRRVVLIDMSEGEMGTGGDVPTRNSEAAAATKVLGAFSRENLKLPDSWFSPYDGYQEKSSESSVVKVVNAIREHRPEIIVAPYFQERHPDHEAASALITKAVFLAGLMKFKTSESPSPFTTRQVIYYQLRNLFTPSFILDISSVAKVKRQAIDCYGSQVKKDAKTGRDTLLNSPLSLQSIEARDHFYGSMIGTTDGEPFFIRNIIGVKDPIAFFRDRPSDLHYLFPEW